MKRVIKLLVISFFYILMLPFGLSALFVYKLLGSQILFSMFAESLSLVPSFPGYFSRGCFYHMTLKNCHVETFVAFGSYISKMETQIGKGVGIGGRTVVGLCEIGDDTVIANNVSILSGSRQHNFDDPDKLITDTENVYIKVHIGSKVFIGDQTVIMANVGDKSIVGSGSIVVKDIPANSVAVGNPAKVVKQR